MQCMIFILLYSLMYMYGMYDTRKKTVDVIGNEICSHSPLLFVLLLLLTIEYILLAFDVYFTMCYR